MTKEELKAMLEAKMEEGFDSMQFNGHCHDCGKSTQVLVGAEAEGDKVAMTIEGGAIYNKNETGNYDLKCPDCFTADPVLHNHPCEVYSRVVGYLRPVNQWNEGKRAEWDQRKEYEVNSSVVA